MVCTLKDRFKFNKIYYLPTGKGQRVFFYTLCPLFLTSVAESLT